jgi:hypothetical protein
MKRRPLWLKFALAIGAVATGLASGGVIPAAWAAGGATIATIAALFHEPPRRKGNAHAKDEGEDEEDKSSE